MLVVEEGVAAGEEEAVGPGLVQSEGQLERLRAVDTQAPGLDDTLVAQPVQDTEGAGTGFLECRQPWSP